MAYKKVALAALTLLLASCGTLQKQAFDGTKTYALVSIACNDKISVNSGNQAGGPASILGMVQSVGKDVGYSEKAEPVFKEILPEIKTAFRQDRHFKLLPENKVLRSAAYKNVAGEDPKGFFVSMVLPDKYKLIRDKDQLKQLARDLNVDGVITVSVYMGYGFSGLNLGGLVSAGAHSAKVGYLIAAVDRDGNTLWSDNIEVVSDKSVPALGDAVNFPKLEPLLVATAKKGVHDVLHKLD
ncbi:MAG TPA: hypothetical protein VNI58_02475 [Mariprofundaceae bacterium]|nr:hypothetical protein [Mariprofundaceae bacterium]